MQTISHTLGTFAPIRVSTTQPHTAKAMHEPVSPQALNREASKASGIWEKDAFSFWDIIDAINPLQHIPIISTIYRKITGDEMGYASRIAGDTLYGGVLGNMVSSLVSAVANVFIDSTTGKDIGEHMMASVSPAKITSSAPAQNHVRPPLQSPIQATARAPVQPITNPPPPPVSALLSKQHTDILPPLDPSIVQAGIDQYQWQTMADEVKNRSSYWA